MLVEAGRVARDTLTDEPNGMRAYRGPDGAGSGTTRRHVGPAMIHGDTILRGQGACDLLTGKPKMRRDPITGEMDEWIWTRNYGCNTPAASEHLMTFRSGAAGFFDLCHDGGTGNFGGFRSSCTEQPDRGRRRPGRPGLHPHLHLLVPEPDVDRPGPDARRRGVDVLRQDQVGEGGPASGDQLGAPGDRRAADGTLWLEFPSTGGASPAVPVIVSGRKVEYFRRHPSTATGESPWVASSGVRGVESVAILLQPPQGADRDYTVRLHFAEPEDLKPGERVFGVTVQGRRMLDDFDVVKEAGRPHKGIVKEFRGVRVDDELRLSFHPTAKRPAVLCGVEIVAE